MTKTTIAQMAAFAGADQADIDAELEAAFSEAIGAEDYQRLLDEQWLPFQGEARMDLPFQDAVASEVRAARAFLETL
ncbi:hypothetical protein Y695_01061 [Hydrogenophaga sp. T4]|nr:hypothetical protein Y695_01061 [Hydrogenophaga sp. T4]